LAGARLDQAFDRSRGRLATQQNAEPDVRAALPVPDEEEPVDQPASGQLADEWREGTAQRAGKARG
jgi:hypothetical protein